MATFEEALAQLGVTEDQINEHIAEQGVVEVALTSTEVRPSEIHGDGLFAAEYFLQGDWIVPIRIDGTLTHLGAASNHAAPANAVLVRFPSGNLFLQALQNIDPDEEIVHDYRLCLWRTHEEPSL